MNINQEDKIISQNEINLYDYWKVLVKRKKLLLGIFFVPLIMAIIIISIIPSYYRGESEITNLIIPASSLVNIVGNIDNAKKNKIFINNSNTIKSVLISIPQKSTDKVKITINAKNTDIISQSFKDLFDYINNLPEIKVAVTTIQADNDLNEKKLIEETDFKMQNLIEAKNANLIFLNHISDMMKKKQNSSINPINPADLIEKDADMTVKIKKLDQVKKDIMKKKELNVKVNYGILGAPSITKQPPSSQVKQVMIIVVILSLITSLFVVFFLDYIDRMKMLNNVCKSTPHK